MWLDAGTGARRGEEDEEGGMDGMATRQQGERKGKVVGSLGEEERGWTTLLHITLKSVSRLL